MSAEGAAESSERPQELAYEDSSTTQADAPPASSSERVLSPARLESVPISQDASATRRLRWLRGIHIRKILVLFDDSRANRAAIMLLVLLGIFFPLYYSSRNHVYLISKDSMFNYSDLGVLPQKVIYHLHWHGLLSESNTGSFRLIFAAYLNQAEIRFCRFLRGIQERGLCWTPLFFRVKSLFGVLSQS